MGIFDKTVWATLPEDTRRELSQRNFDLDLFSELARTLEGSDPQARREARNRVPGEVKAPGPGDIHSFTSDYAELGAAALARGEVAMLVMAGGMATRMGGVVKALVEAIPGKTFLELRLEENAKLAKEFGKPVPLWLMTSAATNGPIKAALAKYPGNQAKLFEQGAGVRFELTGGLFLGSDGRPSHYATGHGDVVDAVRRSGVLDEFIASGGKYVWVMNLDNLGAAIDKNLLGSFIHHGKEVMVEVCEKAPGDRGGIPVHAQGALQVLEEFRLPPAFNAEAVRVFNTNTFLFRAEALRDVAVPWNWFEVEKRVDGRVAIQFERLLQEVTGVLPTQYVQVPREGAGSRFLPVKDDAELQRRQPELLAVLRERGVIDR